MTDQPTTPPVEHRHQGDRRPLPATRDELTDDERRLGDALARVIAWADDVRAELRSDKAA